MMVRVVKRYMLVGACLVQVPLKNDKAIQSLNELERHWGVMKKSPGMPPGANTINPAVIEGGRHPHLLQMNVDYGLLFITYRTKVMNL